MAELTVDLFISLDGFAAGVDVGPFFGYDGPELIRIGGTWYLYVRMSFDPDAPTKRYRLAWKP